MEPQLVWCPQFSWTRIRGESDVEGGGGHGWIEEGEESWVGAILSKDDGGGGDGLGTVVEAAMRFAN